MSKPEFNFDLSSKVQAITRLSLALLALAAIASISPAKAQDQSPQQAADQSPQQAALPGETEPAVETGEVLNLDSSFLNLETDAWHSDAAGLSPARQAHIESCYLAAEAAFRAGVWHGGFGSDTDDVSAFEHGVSDFYAGQRRKSQLGECMQ